MSKQLVIEEIRKAIWTVFSAKETMDASLVKYEGFWEKEDARLKEDLQHSVREEALFLEDADIEICHEGEIPAFYDRPFPWDRIQDLVQSAVAPKGFNVDFEPYNMAVTCVFIEARDNEALDRHFQKHEMGKTDEQIDKMFRDYKPQF
jgi:hypothetical protein